MWGIEEGVDDGRRGGGGHFGILDLERVSGEFAVGGGSESESIKKGRKDRKEKKKKQQRTRNVDEDSEARPTSAKG